MGRESAMLMVGASISAVVLSVPDAAAQAALIGLVVVGLPVAIVSGLLMARWRKAATR